MITLITGQPGAGKTLFTLQFVRELAEKEKRTVHYSGIKDLRLPWLELANAEDWYQVPQGSIVVVDEAQRIFRPRGAGSVVPRHVSELETHRHQGIDLFIITQHPMLVDTNVMRGNLATWSCPSPFILRSISDTSAVVGSPRE